MVRWLLVVIGSVLIAVPSRSQTFSFTSDTLERNGPLFPYVIAFPAALNNLSGVILPMRFVRTVYQIPDSASSSVCMGIHCFSPETDSAEFELPYPSLDFYANLDVYSRTPGTGIISLTIINLENNEQYSLTFTAHFGLTDIEDPPRPGAFALHGNYPNPFNPRTTVSYTLPDLKTPFATSLVVYDLLGREVRTLVNKPESPGLRRVTWDGKNNSGGTVASGVYFYKLRYGPHHATKKMLLVK